jgi:hypothetical protein
MQPPSVALPEQLKDLTLRAAEIINNLGASPQLEYWNIGMMGSAVLELTLQGFIKG